MFPVYVVDSRDSFLAALAWYFQESEGSPPDEDDPPYWPVIRLSIRPRLNCVCA